jgi:hypothetical protein
MTRAVRALLGAVTLLAALTTPALATQYSPPWADVFSFDYPNDATSKDLFTKVSGDKAVERLTATGYHAFDNNLVSASSSMGSAYAQSDAIWSFFGHGRAGAVLFWNGTQYSELLADSSMSPLSSSWGKAYLGSGLTKVRLMVFGACHTANNGGGTLYLGNLQSNANALGVDSTLGFKDLIYWPQMDYWAWGFYQSLKDGKTVDQAAVNAAGYVDYALGIGYWGTDTWKSTGGTKKTVPVGYGS